MERAPGDATTGWAHFQSTMLLALTGAAGYIDAIGFLALGGVFTANMTGNTVLLGLHVGQEQGAAALRSLTALVAFGIGLLLGALIVERADGGPWPRAVNWALALEAALLAVFAVGWHLAGAAPAVEAARGLIAVLAVAMGIQSAAVRRLGVPGIATTYLTGTLTSAITSLVAGHRSARAATEGPGAGARTIVAAWWERGIALQLISLVAYGIGAMIGGLLRARGPVLVAIVPLVLLLLVAGAAARHVRHASR